MVEGGGGGIYRDQSRLSLVTIKYLVLSTKQTYKCSIMPTEEVNA